MTFERALLTVEEIVLLTGVSRSLIYRAIQSGDAWRAATAVADACDRIFPNAEDPTMTILRKSAFARLVHVSPSRVTQMAPRAPDQRRGDRRGETGGEFRTSLGS